MCAIGRLGPDENVSKGSGGSTVAKTKHLANKPEFGWPKTHVPTPLHRLQEFPIHVEPIQWKPV